MLDHAEILKSLVIGANGGSFVAVRETNFGYIIRSDKGEHDRNLRELVVKLALVAVWVAVAGIWLMPLAGAAFAAKTIMTALLLSLAYLGLAMSRQDASGYELHVDTSRRELRSAVVTAKGESWIRNSARFGEVTAPVLRKGKGESDMHSLCLRIAGEETVMPVAVGEEKTLLAIHDRLMRDLCPLEERLAGLAADRIGPRSPHLKVFPPLGPTESVA